MMSIGIEGSAWSAWWRKARKQAESSEWFEVHGTPQKSVVRLLLEAKAMEFGEGTSELHTKLIAETMLGLRKQ